MSEDLIRRSDVIEITAETGALETQIRVKRLPTIEPKRGEWILERLDNYKEYKVTCSCCGWYGVENYDSYVDISDFYFCPYCNADMREREGE